MLTKSVIKKIWEQLASTRSYIKQIRATNIIVRQLEGLVKIEGWETRVQSNSFTIEKKWGFEPEGETDMQYFLNMCGIVNDALGKKLDIKISTGWEGKPNLSSSLVLEVRPRISQRLPVIHAPKVVVNDKTWMKGRPIIEPKEANRVYVFVTFGQSSDCEFETHEHVETVRVKRTKLTGACAEAVAAMK